MMTKLTNSTRVKAPNIQVPDFRSHTTADGRINNAKFLNPSGKYMAYRNRNKGKLKLLNFKNFNFNFMYYISNECTNY